MFNTNMINKSSKNYLFYAILGQFFSVLSSSFHLQQVVDCTLLFKLVFSPRNAHNPPHLNYT